MSIEPSRPAVNAAMAADTPNRSSRAINATDFLAELRQRRWAVAWLLVAFIGSGVAYAFLARPVYRVQAILIPAESPATPFNVGALGAVGGLASLAGIEVGSKETDTVEALALLKSRRFTTDFIRDWKLLPILFPDQWNAENQAWNNGTWPLLGSGPPTEERGFKYFDKEVRSISQDRKTQIVTLTIDWSDRDAAVEWAGELVSRINEEMRLRAIAESTARLKRLEAQISQTNVVALQEALAGLIEREIKRKTVALTREDYIFRIIDPPVAPDVDNPEFPKKWFVVLLAALLGLFLSIVAIYVMAIARKRTLND